MTKKNKWTPKCGDRVTTSEGVEATVFEVRKKDKFELRYDDGSRGVAPLSDLRPFTPMPEPPTPTGDEDAQMMYSDWLRALARLVGDDFSPGEAPADTIERGFSRRQVVTIRAGIVAAAAHGVDVVATLVEATRGDVSGRMYGESGLGWGYVVEGPGFRRRYEDFRHLGSVLEAIAPTSDDGEPGIVALVDGEAGIETWLLNPLDLAGAVAELKRYYANERELSTEILVAMQVRAL